MRGALYQPSLLRTCFPAFFNNLEEVKYSAFSECVAFFGLRVSGMRDNGLDCIDALYF
jgi:hypothetical protein